MTIKTKKSVKTKKAGTRAKKLSKKNDKIIDKSIFDEDLDLKIKPDEIDPDDLDFEDEDELEIDDETEEAELDEIDSKRKSLKKIKLYSATPQFHGILNKSIKYRF